jgi:hypothetical protein
VSSINESCADEGERKELRSGNIFPYITVCREALARSFLYKTHFFLVPCRKE